MKRSIGFCGQLARFTCGKAGRTGFTYDQWVAYGAPSATQRFNKSICVAESVLPDLIGGMRSSASVAVIRATNWLFSGEPGTMGTSPDLAGLSASERMSNRS